MATFIGPGGLPITVPDDSSLSPVEATQFLSTTPGSSYAVTASGNIVPGAAVYGSGFPSVPTVPSPNPPTPGLSTTALVILGIAGALVISGIAMGGRR